MDTEDRRDAPPEPSTTWNRLGRLIREIAPWSSAAPRQVRRLAPFVADAFADAAWMTAWPAVAIGVPVLAFVVGLFAPGYWPGIILSLAHGSYLSSVSFLIAATAVGIMSGAAGVMLVIGYVLGDLLLNPYNPFNDYPMNYIAYDPFWGQPALIVPRHVGRLLITYAVLALLVVRVPQIARRLSDDVVGRLRDVPGARVLVRAAPYALALGLLAYLWSQAAVSLNRPLSTFLGSPSLGAGLVLPLQGTWQWLVGAAIAAGVVRVLAEDWSSRRPSAVHTGTQDRLPSMQPAGNWWTAWPLTVRIVVTSVVTVFLLSGVMDSVIDVFVALICVAAIQVLSSDSGRFLPQRFVRFVTQAPPALRFVLAVGAGFWLLNVILPVITTADAAYRPVLIGALLVMALFAVLFPRTPSVTPDGGRRAA